MIYIIYHKDCMDGVSSAAIANEALTSQYITPILLPLQYSKEDELFQLNLTKYDTCYFVDFSLKRDKMIQLSKLVERIIVIDHHKTAQAELINLPENVEVTFDMNESGATLTYEYFYSLVMHPIFRYIRDRDLWEWKLPDSREINEALAFLVKPNDVESFMEHAFKDLNTLKEIGSTLLKKKNQQVQSKLSKVADLTLCSIEFKIINVTENISELGNEICIEYNKPALMYFITQDMQVICSLRSTDNLPDVSTVATTFGGGGHRNACGFTMGLQTFIQNVLKL